MPNQLDAEVVLRLKNLEKIINDVKKGFSQIKLPELNFSQRDGQNLITFIRALSQSGPQVRAASQNLDQFNAVLGNTARILSTATPGLKAYSNAQRAATQATTRQTQAQARQVSVMEDLGRQTAITVKRFSGFLIARDLIFGLGFAFRSSITDAIKFEREITKIAQLQNTSLDSARQLGKFISNLAVQFGASASELAQASQVLAQAGKGTSEIQVILKSLGQASLTPTFGDLTKTTDSLLAVLGQFNLKAKDTTQVLDILNSVSKDFNVSVDELFEGIRRSGSTFAALSGVKEGVKPGIESLKEFVALFTSVIDTSRESAETIGTAFRTILPRLLRGNTQKLLKKELGLDLLDDEQNFIGPFKAIEGLFKTLGQFKGGNASFSRIIEEIAGGRQFNRLLPLVQEFPKAQRALDIANKSSGSVAKDTQLAFQTLAVQLAQVKQRLQEIGRDLVNSGTFRAYADSFLTLANASATLIKSLEPLLPLITTLVTLKAGVGIAQFSKGFLDNAFHMGPVKKAGGGNVNKVSSLLTPGELVIGPNSVRANGEAALRKFNATGDISSIRSLKGVSMVPGTGNTDSVHANLEPGSFVIKKSSVQKALGLKKYAQGGAVRLASGGPTFGLNPQLGGLDPATTSKLIRFGGELSILGESTKNINRLFKSILASSRDLPTALQRIALELERAGGPPSRLSLSGGGTSSGSLRIPQVGRNFNSNFVSSDSVSLTAASVQRRQIVRASQVEDEDFTNAQLRQSLISRERENKQNIIARALTRRGVDSRWNYTPSFLNQLEIDREQRRQFRARGREINSRYIPASNTLSILDQLESGVGITPRTTPVILRDTGGDLSSSGTRGGPNNPARRNRVKFDNRIRTVFREGGRGASSLFKNGRTFINSEGVKDRLGNSTNLGVAALLAGSAISSNTSSQLGAGTGGFLSGAGAGAVFGGQLGSLGGPQGAAIGAGLGALAGGITGVVTSLKAFNKELQENSNKSLIQNFLDGKADVAAVSGRLSTFSGGKNTDAIQAQFELAIQGLRTTLIETTQNRINRGENLDARQLSKSLSLDQLRVLAAGEKGFSLKDVNNEDKIRKLGSFAAFKLYKSTIEASTAGVKLVKAFNDLAIKSLKLNKIFDTINSQLSELDNTFSNFDSSVNSVLDPSQINAKTRFNVFSNPEGVSKERLLQSIEGIANSAGVFDNPNKVNFLSGAARASVVLRDQIPNVLTQASSNNSTSSVKDVLRDSFSFANKDLDSIFSSSLNTLFGGEDKTFSQLDQKDLAEINETLSGAFDPALKIFERIFNLQEDSARRVTSIVNSRTGLTSRIADQQLGINALGDRRIDIKNQLLGRAPASLGDIQRRVGRDVTSLTGGALSPSAILAEIQNIQKGGVGEDEATRFSNLTKALELLSSDTRILDATLEKNNQLQEVKGNTRSFLERVLSGPDEIAKINQELRDASVIGAGGRVSPTRATAAVRTSQQIFGLFNNEDSLATFGKTSAGLENDLNNILKNQATPFIGDKKLLDLITKNLNTPFALGNQATRAIDTQAEAASSLQQLDQQRVEQLNQLIQEQAGILGAAVRDAFNNEQVNQLTTALGSLKDAQLTLTGKTEVVVSFNNANGVFNGIQDELKTFIGGVVNEQIKQALQGPKIAGANTA